MANAQPLGDVRIIWNSGAFEGDLAMVGADLASGNDLETAVLISLFTHARAPDTYVLTDGSDDRRGWWADTYTADPIGSLLWTFYRRKRDQATLNDLRDTIQKALAWLIADGVARSVDVVVSWFNRWGAQAVITIARPLGPPDRFAFTWSME